MQEEIMTYTQHVPHKMQPALAGEQLEAAFDMFNQLSEQLTKSYGELERQANQLAEELAEARSERLQQLAEKEKLANKLEVVINTLPAGVVVLDEQGRVRQCNLNARAMLSSNLLGEDWQLLAASRMIQGEDGTRLQDGRWVNVRSRPLHCNGGKQVNGKIILITDVTEIREMQARLNQQQRLTSLGEMVAGLAHQIRTPLSSALLYIGNVNHPAASSEARKRYSDKAAESLRHLERMVNDMLIFAGGGVTQSRQFTVAEVIEQLTAVIEPGFCQAGFELQLNVQSPTKVISGNCDALVSAFQNIACNALDALQVNAGKRSEPGHFCIEVCEEEALVVFHFTDNGCGFDNEVKKRLLEPFYTTRSSGTGLGLAVLNETVKRHNGLLKIDSIPGEGSCFTVALPVAQQETIMNSHFSGQCSDHYSARETEADYGVNTSMHEYTDTNDVIKPAIKKAANEEGVL